MAEHIFKKLQTGVLAPATEEAIRYVKRQPDNGLVKLTVVAERSLAHHRKFMAMMRLFFDNQDYFDEFEWFREHTLIAIGYCETAIDRHGNVLTRTKSLRFDKCDQEQFERVYEAAIDWLIKEYWPDVDRGHINSLVQQTIPFM